MGGYRLYFLLVAAVLISGLAAMLPMALTGADALESSYREYAVRDMTANANLFALAVEPYLKQGKGDELEKIMRVAQDGSQTRFTLIAPDGEVVADSEENASRMENHANRPEVREARAGRTGVDIRKSPTLGSDWIYAAIPAEGGKVIRAAASLDELNTRLSQWWKRALAGFAISLAVLFVLALLVARRVAGPLEVAAAGADRYAKGDFSHRIPVSGSAEMRRLIVSLREMAEELDSRFKLILRQREEMRAVFENMNEGILAVAPDGTVMLLNGAAEKILNLKGGAGGKKLESLIRDPGLLGIVKDTASADKPLEKEIRVQAGDGDPILVQVHSARMQDDGVEQGVVLVLRDVTRIRHLEIMRRDFVANVSHELRTPITAIQGSLETLAEETTGVGGQFLDMALRNTRRMGSIINNLLLLAGIESRDEKDGGKAAVCRVRPVIEEALSMYGDAAEARGTKFIVSCDEELTALMNPRLVLQAIGNLIDNAVKYGPEKGEITVTALPVGDEVGIMVTDSGPGIAPRFQPRVFERFYRVDGSSRLSDGSGLGLALVKHIALAQGGSIKLESAPGSGSTFKLFLPRS